MHTALMNCDCHIQASNIQAVPMCLLEGIAAFNCITQRFVLGLCWASFVIMHWLSVVTCIADCDQPDQLTKARWGSCKAA